MKLRNKKLGWIVGLLGFAAASQTVFADNDQYDVRCRVDGRTITLDYDGEKFEDRSVFHLKGIIQRRCDRFRGGRLESLTLVAKSKRDYSKVNLEVGRYLSHDVRLSDDYRPVVLRGPARQLRDSQWKLHLSGKVKIDRIVLRVGSILDRRPLPPIHRPLPPVHRPLPPIYRPLPPVYRVPPVVRRAPRHRHRNGRRVERNVRRVARHVRRVARHVRRAVRRTHRRVHRRGHNRDHRRDHRRGPGHRRRR